MANFCNECPAAEFIVANLEKGEHALAVNVAQGLSGQFADAVEGTKGLTDAKIEFVRQSEIDSWRESEEADLLKEHPGLAKAVYGCEEKIQILGNCAIHSKAEA